ncbi:MAG TPA: GMC family oxidoreductase [bacterium]|nr:GMC family oxidoreductase [bacterium]
MKSREAVEALVIGSGPGGSVTALELSRAGVEVLVLEEGGGFTLDEYGAPAPEAMKKLYRRRGMTPVTGPVPIGYVEGSCVGGSSEINCGFWLRASRETLQGWESRSGLVHAGPDDLAPHYLWAEELLGVQKAESWPMSTRLLARGVAAMGWASAEIPRAAGRCRNSNTCSSGCATGAKKGMSRTLIPLAQAAGATVRPYCRAVKLIRDGTRIAGAVVRERRPGRPSEEFRVDARYVFVCAGPTETPSLLRRSGVRHNVGNSLGLHPMLKVVARFEEEVNAEDSVLPLIQVHEFWPEITLGGAFFSLGHLALLLSENWPANRDLMRFHRHMASYYVAVRGTGRGGVRPAPLDPDGSMIFYKLSRQDLTNLSQGLARLSTVLLAGGAREVYACVAGLPRIQSEAQAMTWLDRPLPRSALGLTTVHAFGSCPMGEPPHSCAADSFGLVHGFTNLYLNDASMLPDSPGPGPQSTIMAVARRNVTHFLEGRK